MGEQDREYVLVTEYFHPDMASTGQLMTDLAVGLHERGLDIQVYTGQPNYHSGETEKQPIQDTHKGVPVRRIRAPQVRQSSLPRRLFNWTVFTIWMSVVLLVDSTEKEREILFVTCPPILPEAMWAVCQYRGWEYTYIAYDLYPDSPVELGYITKGGFLHQIWEAVDRQAFRNAKHIVALGPVMKNRIRNKVGDRFDDEKIRIIHNWEDEEFITPRAKEDNRFSRKHDLVEPFTILYSGNIAPYHDLETLVDAAAEIQNGERADEIRFLTIGEGDSKQHIVDYAEEHGVRGTQIQFLPYQPLEELPYSLTSGNVSVVSVQEGLEGVCVSCKLYTAMAAGQPLLVISQPNDDEARIVEQFDAGISVEQEDVEGIVEAIERWSSNPELVERQGENAREAFEEHFVKEKAIDQYHKMLTERQVRSSEPVEVAA